MKHSLFILLTGAILITILSAHAMSTGLSGESWKSEHVRKDFEVVEVLKKPLILNLATICPDGPRDSVVWFLYDEQKIWLFGTRQDHFVKRLELDPRCSFSVVDLNLEEGVLRHVSGRCSALLHDLDEERLHKVTVKYLGGNSVSWNKWFIQNILDPLDVMVELPMESVISKDLSYFKTGPGLATSR